MAKVRLCILEEINLSVTVCTKKRNDQKRKTP